MKSIVLSSVVTALLIFSGCSDKKPAVDDRGSQSNVQEVAPVQTETISSENASISGYSNGNTISGHKTISELEDTLNSVYFDFDKFSIRTDMTTNVTSNADIVNTKASEYTIKLEGNCDEWGSDEYNFALGLKRTNAVKKSLVAEGIDSSRISMVSYGESNPVCSDKTQECWAKNRRVDFKLLP